MNFDEHALELFNCLTQCTSTRPLTERCEDMSIEDAYQVSLKLLKLREQRGEVVIGKKIGVTSKGVQDMLGVYQPDFGFLTNEMLCQDGKAESDKLILPRAEAEIAFKLKTTLKGPGITAEDVLRATEAIMPSIEIVDSRIENWEIKIQDTVADNASCGYFVVGEETTNLEGLNLADLSVTFNKNGVLESSGTGAAVMGNPLNAVAWLANTLGEMGVSLNAGETILSGSMVPLAPAQRGDVFEMHIEELGSCSVEFV